MKNIFKIVKIPVLALCALFLFNGCSLIVATAMLAPGYGMARDLRNRNLPIDYSDDSDKYNFLGSAYQSTMSNYYQITVIEEAKNDLKMKLSKKLFKVFENMIEESGISLNGKIGYEFNDEIERKFSREISDEIDIKTEKEDTTYYRKWAVVLVRKKTAIDIGKKVIEDILKENSKVYFSKELEKEILERVKRGLENY